MMNDLSENNNGSVQESNAFAANRDALSQKNSDLLAQIVKDQSFSRRFRSASFIVALIFSALCLITFLVATMVVLYKSTNGELVKSAWHIWSACLLLLAIVPTTLLLALLRFAFRTKEEENKDSRDVPGLLFQFIKEITEVVKAYSKNKT